MEEIVKGWRKDRKETKKKNLGSGGLNQIAAFSGFAAGAEGMIFREGDDFDQLAAEPLDCAARGVVVGVAGDPDDVHAMSACQGEQQAAGALGVVVATRGGIDVVAGVAGEEADFF